MKVRGRRECRDCGTTWSYYETGSVECPDCGSVHSVGLDDDRRLHTGTDADLDLSAARAATEESPSRAAEMAVDAAREYCRDRGFVVGGKIRPLDEEFLRATELRHTGAAVARRMRVDEATERHLLALLSADGDRPAPDAVPESLRAARGLGIVDAVEAYADDLRTYLAEEPDEAAESVLGSLDQHTARVSALDGEVPPAEAERLVAVARAVGEYLRTGDEAAVARARERLRSGWE